FNYPDIKQVAFVMKLHQAFDIVRGDVVAFTGAGGKTSALIGLGYELAGMNWRVLASTTMHIPAEQLQLFPHTMHYNSGAAAISDALTAHQFVFLHGEIRDGLVYGADETWTRQLLDSVDSDVLLLEADFADGKALKAPLNHEPVIPDEATLVVPVMSLAALNKPFDDDHVYNPTAMTEKYGFYPGKPIRAPWLAQILRDGDFALKGIPLQARVIAYLNQGTNSAYTRNRARVIAQLALKSGRLQGVAPGAVRSSDPVSEVQRAVGAIVVAAGKSSRMGQPKVLLPWIDNRSIIEHITRQLIRARLSHINVVTGYYATDVKRLIKPYEVKTVHNRSHRTGEMFSSLRTGLKAMPDNISAALLVLGDQPRIQPKIIYDILSAYAQGKGRLIIPSFQRRRGHPILIDRRYWQEILSASRNTTLRDIINTHSDDIHYVNVNTDSVLRDVDTPDDYAEERRKAGLRHIDIHRLKPDIY
ncbi:MAG: selenium cofactor biosynthesis protein YqeC, partial [Aggregatilineales bacterium]